MGEDTMHDVTPPESHGAWRMRRALPALAAQWTRLGAPIADALAPGIHPTEVEEIFAPHGLRVPSEVLAMWEWHNGVLPAAREARPYTDFSIGPGGYDFLSAQESLEAYLRYREWHPYREPEYTQAYWHESWLPIFIAEDKDRLYVDCERVLALDWGSSPLRSVSWEWENFDIDMAPSVENAVLIWTWLLEAGFYMLESDGDDMNWDADWPSVPLFVKSKHLA